MKVAAPALLALLILAACSSTAAPAARSPVTGGPQLSAPSRASSGASAAAAVSSTTPAPLGEGPQTTSMAALKIGGERHATIGNPDAAVTVVEFSDYGCPYCRLHSASGFPEIKRRFVDTGQVYYVFKDFPVAELHPQAALAAQAAECAGEQGEYWAYHDQLFTDPRQWEAGQQAALDSFGRYASALGMDADALRSCIGDGRYADEVATDFAEARALGLTGTPVFIINGKLLSGARTPEQFVALLELEVERAKMEGRRSIGPRVRAEARAEASLAPTWYLMG